MCGRYILRGRFEQLARAFLAEIKFDEFTDRPRFNIAPSQNVPLLRIGGQGQRVIDSALWGLIPSWVKGTPKIKPINARAETVPTSPMFRQAFDRRRCLIPADGFYEWRGPKPPKQPFFIHMKDDSLFAFAGLWERWRPEEEANPIDTCTIITTEPNELMRPIHNRMPVILHPENYARWLDRETPGDAVNDLLRPYDANEMTAHPINTRVNSVKNEGEELIEEQRKPLE